MSSKSASSPQIAYLGMGIMGASMAVNLAKAGFAVNVWNRSPGKEGTARAQEAGARHCAELKEALAEADFIFLCLTDVSDLQDLLLKENGVLAYAKEDAVIIDMSTTGPACARNLSAELSSRKLHFLDAPVSGGDSGARNATLTIMVGGEPEIFERCLPVFERLGKNIHYCGPSGSGQAVKLCNQILCAVNMLAVCESLKLASAMGISSTQVIEVCGSGAAGSWALSNLGPRIARGDLEPGFMIKDMRKDLRLVFETLGSFGLEASLQVPASLLADSRFEQAAEAFGESGPRKGTQAMIESYR